jgi:hypothetical protein
LGEIDMGYGKAVLFECGEEQEDMLVGEILA